MPPAPVPERPRLAVVVAGGSGRRLGLVDKPALEVDGRTLLSVALAAVAPARTVVVGPARELPATVLQVREDPPGGGPAAAVAAGLAALVEVETSGGASPLELSTTHDERVAVLAADLPGIDAAAIDLLTLALAAPGEGTSRIDGAVLVDADGRSQYLAGVWRLGPLLAAVRSRPSWHHGRLSDLLEPLIGVRVPAGPAVTADIDTPADLVKWQSNDLGSVRGSAAGPGPAAQQAMME